MVTVCQQNKCNGCMACIDRCPKNCISIVDNLRSYNALKNMNMCVSCGLCEKVCPNNNPVELLKTIDSKQGWARSEIRDLASSGGAASVIIKSFIENGGYVASCLYREGQFVFEITNDIVMAREFTGSKYVKSNPIGIYKKIQDTLAHNKVLFIGLPCQVAGLKNYLGNHDYLYTIDLVCHGTPSPLVLNRFFEEYGYGFGDFKDIKFRKNSDYNIYIDDDKKFEKSRDPYMISFLNSIDYTENCYSCEYATRDRCSDLTLGDSWGTELRGEIDKGISLILVQSHKGQALLESANLELREVDYERAVQANHQLNHPSILIPEREEFFRMLEEGKTIKYATNKLLPKEVLKQKVKYIIKK